MFGFPTPRGMSRRHFLRHLAGSAALMGPALSLGHTLRTHAADLKRRRKSAILLWMNGGPPTIDMFDMKPGTNTGGPFQPIASTGDAQVCEHLPQIAQQMHHYAVVRSMSTQEADHGRGRYFMRTGYQPDAEIEHPSYGAVISHELINQRPELEIPPFISIGGASEGPGFLGMAWAPFSVSNTGRIRNLEMGLDQRRLMQRMAALDLIERGFIAENRGSAATDHQKVLRRTLDLMTSEQMDAFQINQEPERVRERYGNTGFGRGCLMARRLVETGVPFVEVNLGGWDLHSNIFPVLEDNKFPELDQAMSALTEDLEQRGLLQDTVVLWMGEFGRTPNINGNAGRDHWARGWSVVVGGSGINGGITVGQTNATGTGVESEPYNSQDLMASVCHALGISLETTFTSRSGRPMQIANSGKVIRELFS